MLPKGAVDAHVHMLGSDFPLWDGRVEDPSDGTLDEWVERLNRHLDFLGFEKVLVVHSIVYGDKNDVTLGAIDRLGSEKARGIGLIKDEGSEAELDQLRAGGVVGVRLNYVHGGVLSWEGAKKLAPSLRSRDMHIQMLLHAHQHMIKLADEFRSSSVPIVLDHIGWPDLSLGVDEPGFRSLCDLVSEGSVYVKLSAIYRMCSAPYDAADEFIAALIRANPERCLWGSDWPHIMLADADMPDAGELLNQFLSVCSNENDRQKILTDVPTALYGF